MRLIDKDKLLEDMNVIKKGFDGQGDFNLSKCALVYATHQCIETVKQQPTVEENKWISVETRYPTHEEYCKNDGRFIVTDGNRRYQALFFMYGKEPCFCQIDFFNSTTKQEEPLEDAVIAWQPLPKTYEPKGSE